MDHSQVGDKVVCINEKWPDRPKPPNIPIANQVYTIRAIITSRYGSGIGYLLKEIVNTPMQYCDKYGEAAFDRVRFRPVNETDIKISLEVFNKLLVDMPDKEELLKELEDEKEYV